MADCMLTCGAIVKENPTRVEMLSTDLRADLMHPPPFQFMRATLPFSFGSVGDSRLPGTDLKLSFGYLHNIPFTDP